MMHLMGDTPMATCVRSHSHKVKRAVGDEEHLLSMLRQLLQHSMALFTIADILSCGEREVIERERVKNGETQAPCIIVCAPAVVS